MDTASPNGTAALNAGCLVVDASLVIRHWSAPIELFSGLKSQEATGQPLSKVLPHLPNSWRAAFDQILDDLLPRVLEGAGPFSHGATHAVVTAFPVGMETSKGATASVGIGVSVVDTGCRLHAPEDGEVPEIRSRLEELGMFDDPEFLRESLDEFLTNARDLLSGLIGADGAGSSEEMAKTAHRLAGSALTMGAETLGRMAGELEANAWSGVTQEQLDALQVEADRVFSYCDALRAG